ncbi:hypothetical protein [Sulfuracidifex tepidarius]|uniref:Uncharacterized protein n=1 Tax=Sulfuracidifex tepidarius TaxID=1294262 RepID=A0A510E5N3_9CREN|nr:hypothetical protein [Sulfuracidifex tepidarius]BBG27809.1 hypothetical protein IC007_2363 [Sulfuracidifex tepidarius]
MARLREYLIGWLRTVSGLDEKSFPLGIKNINIKELLVIFPLIMIAIALAFRDIMVSFAALVPVIFIILYEEKSMDEFQYVYYFIKFYLRDLMKPSEKKAEKKTEVLPMLGKYIDLILTVVGAMFLLISVQSFVRIAELQAMSLTPMQLWFTIASFGIGTGLLSAQVVYFVIKKIKKEK